MFCEKNNYLYDTARKTNVSSPDYERNFQIYLSFYYICKSCDSGIGQIYFNTSFENCTYNTIAIKTNGTGDCNSTGIFIYFQGYYDYFCYYPSLDQYITSSIGIIEFIILFYTDLVPTIIPIIYILLFIVNFFLCIIPQMLCQIIVSIILFNEKFILSNYSVIGTASTVGFFFMNFIYLFLNLLYLHVSDISISDIDTPIRKRELIMFIICCHYWNNT